MSRDRASGGDFPPFDKPNLRTSRRNFIAGASVLAGALVATAVSGKRALAKDDPNGCDYGSTTVLERNPECHCFLAGTRIATPNGEVEIEKLQMGDLVVTISGEPKPIKWIARRYLRRAPSEAWNPGVTPVKVARFALDGETPHADLYLSAGHAIYLYGLLIPAKSLVNGRSITDNQDADALSLDYYHIELEKHDVVLAGGAPVETYDGSSRWSFDNAEEYESLYGAAGGINPSFAPVVSYGRRTELMSRLRSIVSPIYDARRPIDIIWDQIASRAELELAA